MNTKKLIVHLSFLALLIPTGYTQVINACDDPQSGVIQVSTGHEQEQPSLFKNACSYIADHPIATAAVGGAIALGAYALCTKNECLMDVVTYQKNKISQSLSLMLKAFKTPVEWNVAKTVIADPKVALKPMLSVSAAAALHYFDVVPLCVKRICRDSNAQEQSEEISPKEHILHGLLTFLASSLVKSEITDSSITKLKANDFIYRVLVGPIVEEVAFTYVPYMIGGKYAKFFMPARFSIGHQQYNAQGQVSCGILNYMAHSSVQSGYIYSPIIQHMLNNFCSYLQHGTRLY